MAHSRSGCLIPNCGTYGCNKQVFKRKAIEKLITLAGERQHNTFLSQIESLLNNEDPSVELHKGCYCTYTSKKYKRKTEDGQVHVDEPPTVRVRRSQTLVDGCFFDFRKHCLFCNEKCIPLDPRHPDRWDKVRQCQTKERPGMMTFRDSIVKIAEERNDELGRRVLRNIGEETDLPARDAQYHERCYKSFQIIPKFVDLSTSNVIHDAALKSCIDAMYANQDRFYSRPELFEMYSGYGGMLSSKQMFVNLKQHLGDEIITIRCDGCASLIGFKQFVGKTIKLVKTTEGEEESDVDVICKVHKEARELTKSNNLFYDLGNFTHSSIIRQTSPTLLHLVSGLVSRYQVTKQSISLTQSIQSHITNCHNQTTLGLAVKLHHKHGSSELIKELSHHGYVASYDEVLRFRKSAATFVQSNVLDFHRAMGLEKQVGVIFGWMDNLDLQINTPNGRRDTHAMAHEFQQSHPCGIVEVGCARPSTSSLKIPRLRKTDTKRSTDTDDAGLALLHYTGKKKVDPPALPHVTNGPSYEEVTRTQTSLHRAQEKDTQWLNSLFKQSPPTPPMEWSGFNSQLARQSAETVSKQPSTYLFGPLIDAPPAHPDTVLTSLVYMMKSLKDLGMTYFHLSPDMQLYIQAMQIKWSDPLRFQNLILRPGVMHIVQNMCRCIRHLMKGSGLEILIGAAFGGVSSIMCQGKPWVRAIRAYRMVSCILLQSFLQTGFKTFDEICDYLEKARLHPTGRHWVDNLITPTLLTHQLLRAEREGDWLLQQLCIKRLLPYFFAAGHHNYARYLSWHIIEMSVLLPADAKNDLLSGAFVCRHKSGSWNSVSADQFGEQTAIKIGKGGLKGISLSPQQVAEWIDSFPISAYISDILDHCYSTDQSSRHTETPHKEEGANRRKLDEDDRRRISIELDQCSHPLENNSDVLYNIHNGQVAPTEVNVADSLDLGATMATAFCHSLPSGFHAALTSPVKTMEHLKRGVKIGEKVVFDPESIFLRLLMVGQQREMELIPIFGYELCAVPPSIVDEYGCLRKGNKSVLVQKLGVRQCRPQSPDVVIIDAQQLLYHVVWPCGGSVGVLAESMKARIALCSAPEKILVFDHYAELSPKDHERQRRAGVGATTFNLDLKSPLPSRETLLKNKVNKRNLSRLLSTFDLGCGVSVESKDDGVFLHEEADVTVISYLFQAADAGRDVVRILSDDSDIFVLLVYWTWRYDLQGRLSIQMEKWDGVVLDINATCANLGDTLCSQLLGAHAITGCDTVSYPFSKGKASVLKTLKTGIFPGLFDVLGEEDATEADLMAVGQQFFAALYGQPEGTTMTQARYNLYTRKRGKPLRIMSLPPTDKNLYLHVRRAHLQTLLWKAADKQGPPNVSITEYGWEVKDGMVCPCIDDGPPGPPPLMSVISCGCHAKGKACKETSCSCHREKLRCTVYCLCTAGDDCWNPFTKKEHIEEDDDTDGNEDNEDPYSYEDLNVSEVHDD